MENNEMSMKTPEKSNGIAPGGKIMEFQLLRWSLKIFIIFAIISTIPLFAGSSLRNFTPFPKAEAGIIDLTKVPLEQGTVSLDGQWEFYWDLLLEPGEPVSSTSSRYIEVPGSWNKYTSNKATDFGDGYGTYRLRFVTGENTRLALKIPRMRTAYKLWVNGELIASSGTVGKTRDTMVPQYMTNVSSFEVLQGENEILIQVSNFHHRSGGIMESLRIGGENQIFKLKNKNMAVELIIFGSLICIGVYHLVLFFFRRKKDPSTMYFGLFCVFIAVRTTLGGESFFIYFFPAFNWEIAHKILTSTYYLGVPLMLMFFMEIFPEYFHERIIKISQITALVFTSILIFTPARIFSVVNILYQVWSIAVILYIAVALIKIIVNKEKDSWIISLGAVALLMGSMNDIVFFLPWVSDNELAFFKDLLKSNNLASLGQFIFACINSLLIAKRFSDALEQEEIVTSRLTEMNAHLDDLVFQRTKDLAESNRKIEHQNLELEKKNQALQKLSFKDSLTEVWNRRKYDQMIEKEWNRCLRYQRPIALLVLDIDYFKRFNDFYGHMAGDECLVKIGQVLKNSLSRSTDMAARYGGEEFVVLLPETGKEEALEIAAMLRQKIEDLNIPHEKSMVSDYVTVSIGVTSAVPDLNSLYQDLFGVADKALYQAKDAGRNRIKFLSE
ncbi:MAG: diguanylate cyclase [Lacrimispora sp.]|uniref:sensor domain-containing diguanylate cyclase n=1 Tax=Lacrimispora sp. TaxID=2719234 RepID=UPI0039E5AD09